MDSPGPPAADESAAGQRELWSANADDWAGIQEPQSRLLYHHVLADAGVREGTALLDAGCAGGVACRAAADLGATVTGVDITPRLIEIARGRVPGATFLVGEIEDLPVDDESFDVVTAFASIMFAADPPGALGELARVAKPGGAIAAVVPDPEHSDWWAFVGAVVDALPSPPEVRNSVIDLSDGPTLETLYRRAGLQPRPADRIDITWSYRDEQTALRALMSPGPITGAAADLGLDEVERIARSVLPRFAAADGSYHLKAANTVVIGTK